MPNLDPKTEKAAIIYLRERLRAGSTVSALRRELLEKRYSMQTADMLLEKAQKRPSFALFAIILIVILALSLAAYLLFFSAAEKKCPTAECFVTSADECESASFQQAQGGSIFEYSTKNCILTKTVIQLNETEPPEIKELLEGKSMRCEYEKGNFDTELVGTISIGIENCTGELKDNIELLAAV
jgi:hypothetical protein